MGMAPAEVPFYGPVVSKADEIVVRSVDGEEIVNGFNLCGSVAYQYKSNPFQQTRNYQPRPESLQKKPSSIDSTLLSSNLEKQDGEVLSLSEVSGTLLNWRADSVRQGRHEVVTKEASTLGSGKRSFADGFQEVRDSTKKLLQAFQQIRADFQEWREEVEASTQVIVPSKVTQVGDGLFLDAHNLLEEMPIGDGSAKLQEMGDFE